ncbi:MAG: Pyrophosphate--fructose 6-phosphate 1-phosphotransferase [Chlamydiales bacterium]|nr:Pyrophosphate--fructose 6-phosphate 1-phosphotransferase [Chlamydiales bacterium]
MKSPIEEARLTYKPPLPGCLKGLAFLQCVEGDRAPNLELKEVFPKTYAQPRIVFRTGEPVNYAALRVGVVLSGGQAAGGHNVITGLFDALKKMHPNCRLFGFLGGPAGIIDGNYVELKEAALDPYRNMGGFDLLGSGRTKIETPEQLLASKKTVEALNLDGLVVVGGDDSNTNAAVLAEYFLTEHCHTRVVGVPKTIDGDLKSVDIETSFGFDSACKTYSELIGNIARDALSAKKYTHFIKLMGRSASHVTLECALQTHPNSALIGEEVAARQMTLHQIAEQVADLLSARSQEGKNYGVILIPEGLIEFIPELNLKNGSFPKEIAEQLELEKDPHGNVQLSQIATEQLLTHIVEQVLKERSDYKGKFAPVHHFFGYEGRACLPSNFDTHYCYALGHTAALLVQSGCTGYMSVVRGLSESVDEWEVAGVPLTTLMTMEERKGSLKPVIKKALVDLKGAAFHSFASRREVWGIEDHYRYPGPIQFFGSDAICNATTLSLHKLNGMSKVAPTPQ